jgi:glycosyltransferase involved in cell wall biosynthesis
MSREEPSALVYLEAASTGLPLVVHDSPVVRWTLGEAALYVETRDLAAVANALRHALDPAIGRTLGCKARDRMVASWSWKALAAQYRDFFFDLLGPRIRRQEAGGKPG